MKTYHYFEACGFVSAPFRAADLDAAKAHALATFRDPADPDFDNDDGGIVGQVDDEWWECLAIFHGDTAHNPDNAGRLSDAIAALTGPDAPIPGGP